MERLAQLIQRTLKDEYINGATFKELERKYGVAYSYIRSLMNGDKPITRMSLEVFLKLFPGIENVISDHLSGVGSGGGRQEANGNTNSHITQSIGGNATVVDAGGLDAYRGRLYSAILGLGLDDATTARVARCIREA